MIYAASDLHAALSRLESGSLPGHPWQLLRPLPDRQPFRLQPHAPQPLGQLRILPEVARGFTLLRKNELTP